jgi:hypothetical protein
MTPGSLLICITTTAALLTGAPVFADATLVLNGTRGEAATIQVKNGVGRMAGGGDGEYILFDSATETLIQVDPNRQQYRAMSREKMESTLQVAAQLQHAIAPQMKELRAGLAGLPEDQRRVIEQRMGAVLGAPAAGNAPVPATMKAVSNGTHSIAGLECESHALSREGQPVGEVCLVKAASGKLSQQDFKVLEAMMVFARNMASRAGGMVSGLDIQLAALPADLQGVPVSVKDAAGGWDYRLVSLSDETLPEEPFREYTGFQLQAIPGLN